MATAHLIAVSDPIGACIDQHAWDAVVLITPTLHITDLPDIYDALQAAAKADAALQKGLPMVTVVPAPKLAGARLVVGLTGPIDRDFDDVRRYGEAAKNAIVRAREAGAKRPLLLIPRIPINDAFQHATEVCLLSALAALWEPLEAREARDEATIEPITHIGFVAPAGANASQIVKNITALEEGRRLARDLASANSERMTPIAFATHCENAFDNSGVSVQRVDDTTQLNEQYPLLMAVARGSLGAPRHRPCVVRLSYEGAGPITQTLFLAGKGVTFDTGGVDVKARGQMSGMSGDKGGAASVVGFMLAVARLEPRGLRVIAELGLVRNSIGSNGYVADEILVSHAGVRVKVANTDAEGRLVLADLLSHLREHATNSIKPQLLSIATLTGHAVRCVGPYTVVVENEPARKSRLAAGLSVLGDLWADPVEISRLRREDYDFIRPRSQVEDIQQSGSAPSVATDRGHQFPAAFLLRASRLDEHGCNSKLPLAFAHVDIAASAFENTDWQFGRATAAFVTAMAARWLWDDL